MAEVPDWPSPSGAGAPARWASASPYLRLEGGRMRSAGRGPCRSPVLPAPTPLPALDASELPPLSAVSASEMSPPPRITFFNSF